MERTETMEEMEQMQRMFPLHPLLQDQRVHKVNVERKVSMVLRALTVAQEQLEFLVRKAQQEQREQQVVVELVHKVRQEQLDQQVVVQLEHKVQLEQPVRVVRREQLDRPKLQLGL
jgi:hypothetical protein